MEVTLNELVPRIVPGHTFRVHAFQGKLDLLRKLEARLRGYANMASSWPDLRVIVVVDRDSDDCKALKQRLVDICDAAGFKALCRIAIEELEAWFFGDVLALRAAYPKIPASLAIRAGYRDPDAILGGTWEALQRVLNSSGYYKTGMPKVEVARRVTEHMIPERNTSGSFQVLRSGLEQLV